MHIADTHQINDELAQEQIYPSDYEKDFDHLDNDLPENDLPEDHYQDNDHDNARHDKQLGYNQSDSDSDQYEDRDDDFERAYEQY